jgi:hypothetical protein
MGTPLLRSGMRLVNRNQFELTVVLLKLEGFGAGTAQPKVLNRMRVLRALSSCVMKTE